MTVPFFVAELEFDPPLVDGDDTATRRLDACLQARGARWTASWMSKDRSRAVCRFEAPDAESVREAFRTSGNPFLRVWPADCFAIDDPKPGT